MSRGDAGEQHAPRHLSSATRLGLTLRSVMLTPREGYASALKAAERRERTGERPPEGWTPYVLAALGGAGAMSLWLKLSALGGLRAVRGGAYDGGVLAAALVLGALLCLAAQLAWGFVGPHLVARLGGSARPRDLRLAWGAAFFPLAFVLLLLPPDLAVAGPATFTTQALQDSVAKMWAALSVAVTVSLGLWSAWLFARGIEVATSLRMRRAVFAVAAAVSCLGVAIAAIAWAGGVALTSAPS